MACQCRVSSQRRFVDARKTAVNATTVDGRAPCVLHFYHDAGAFRAERAALQDPRLRHAMPSNMVVVRPAQLTHESLPLLLGVRSFPPAVVTERCTSLSVVMRTKPPDFSAALQVRPAHACLWQFVRIFTYSFMLFTLWSFCRPAYAMYCLAPTPSAWHAWRPSLVAHVACAGDAASE